MALHDAISLPRTTKKLPDFFYHFRALCTPLLENVRFFGQSRVFTHYTYSLAFCLIANLYYPLRAPYTKEVHGHRVVVHGRFVDAVAGLSKNVFISIKPPCHYGRN